MKGETNAVVPTHMITHRRRSSGSQGLAQIEGLLTLCVGEGGSASSSCSTPSPASCPSLTNPVLRANSYPKVTVPKKALEEMGIAIVSRPLI
jgi:hypothetical protein